MFRSLNHQAEWLPVFKELFFRGETCEWIKECLCNSTVLTSASRDPSSAEQQALQLHCFKKVHYHQDFFSLKL